MTSDLVVLVSKIDCTWLSRNYLSDYVKELANNVGLVDSDAAGPIEVRNQKGILKLENHTFHPH